MGATAAIDEDERLRTVATYEVVSDVPDTTFDDVACVAAEIGDAPIALVTLLDRTLQWNKGRVGTALTEIPRDASFCAFTIEQGGHPLVVDDASQDARFSRLPWVLEHKVLFYAGVPVRAPNGALIGTVCVLDKFARTISRDQLHALRALAREVIAQLELRRTNAKLARALERKDEVSQFLAHELNGMVTTVGAGVALASRAPALGAELRAVLTDVQATVRRAALVTRDFLDVALGDEGQLRPHLTLASAEALMNHVLVEARLLLLDESNTDRIVPHAAAGDETIATDAELAARIALNYLRNALKYAPPSSAIALSIAACEDASFELRVGDTGPGIAAGERETIFGTFERIARDDDAHVRTSSGLGLAFCRVASAALGGRVWVEANAQGGSDFVLRIPDLRASATRMLAALPTSARRSPAST